MALGVVIPLTTVLTLSHHAPPFVFSSFAVFFKLLFFGADPGAILRRGSNGGLPRQMGGRPCLTCCFFVFVF